MYNSNCHNGGYNAVCVEPSPGVFNKNQGELTIQYYPCTSQRMSNNGASFVTDVYN